MLQTVLAFPLLLEGIDGLLWDVVPGLFAAALAVLRAVRLVNVPPIADLTPCDCVDGAVASHDALSMLLDSLAPAPSSS